MASTPQKLIADDPYVRMMFLQFVEKRLGQDHEFVLFMKAVDGFRHARKEETKLAVALEVWEEFLMPGAKYEIRIPQSESMEQPTLQRTWTGLLGNVALAIKRAKEALELWDSLDDGDAREEARLAVVETAVPSDVFDTTREAVLEHFQEVHLEDFAKSPLFLKATATDVRKKRKETPIDAVEEELLSGSRKLALSQWWLLLIRSEVNEFLHELGYVDDAVPDNYTMEPPREIPLVRMNRKTLSSIMDPTRNEYGVQELAKRLCDTIYPKITEFRTDCMKLLLRKSGLLLEPNADSRPLKEIMDRILAMPYTPEDKDLMLDLSKDLEYLAKMEILEESKGGGTRDLDVVPISGIIMGTFARLENECKTVLELWDWEYPFSFDNVGQLLAQPDARNALRTALTKPSKAAELHLVQLWEAIRAFKASCAALTDGDPAAVEACRSRAYRIRQSYLAPQADVKIPCLSKEVKQAVLTSLAKTMGAPHIDTFKPVEMVVLRELEPTFEKFVNSSKFAAFKEMHNPNRAGNRPKVLKRKHKKTKSTDDLTASILSGPTFTEADWGLVTLKTADKRYSTGEVILSEGQAMTSFFYIRSGCVTILKTTTSGKKVNLARKAGGEFLGELSFLSKGTHTASASVIAGDGHGPPVADAAVVAVIPVDRLSRNLVSDSALASKFFRMICLDLSKRILVPGGSLTPSDGGGFQKVASMRESIDVTPRRMSSLSVAVANADKKTLFQGNSRLLSAATAVCDLVGIPLESEEQILISYQCRHQPMATDSEKKKKKKAGILILMADFIGFYAKAFASKTVVAVPVSCLVQVALPAKGGTAVRAIEEKVQGTIVHIFTFSSSEKAHAAGTALKNYLNAGSAKKASAAAKAVTAPKLSHDRPSAGLLGRGRTPSNQMLHTFVFSNESWDAILSGCSELKKYVAGDVVLSEGQEPDCMYQLLSGTVRVRKGPRFITTLHEGSMFGEISFMLQQTASADVVVHSQDAVVMRLKLGPLLKLLNRDPKLGACFFYYLATVLCPRVLAMNEEATAK